MKQDMRRENKVCWGCEYVITDVLDNGPPFECDPPMGECPLDRPVDPSLVIVNGREEHRHFPVEDY